MAGAGVQRSAVSSGPESVSGGRLTLLFLGMVSETMAQGSLLKGGSKASQKPQYFADSGTVLNLLLPPLQAGLWFYLLNDNGADFMGLP